MCASSSSRRIFPRISADSTPIIRMLADSLKKESASFHMPGHKNGQSFSRWLKRNALSIDTTELATTDDINRPQRAVKEALSLAAKAFGAKETFFITAGSTAAVHAALASAVEPGGEVIVFRSSHKSVMNACMLFRLTPVFTAPECVAEVLSAHPRARAVFVTRPDYYGNCIDIRELAVLTHRAEKILIVDEAHGTHFAFCPSLLPVPAVSNGGDIVIQSAHKTVPALTQGAYLHLSEEAVLQGRADPSRIREILAAIVTSSPSFLIAATLDYARAFLETCGDAASKTLFSSLRHFYSFLDPQWIPCFPPLLREDGKAARDPFRIVLSCRGMPFSSRELAQELAACGIQIEFYDLQRLVLICKFGNTKKEFSLLAGTLNRFIEKKRKAPPPDEAEKLWLKQLEQLDHKLRRAMDTPPVRVFTPDCGISKWATAETVPLRNAFQRVLLTGLVPYPPGIPLLWPGERLSAGTVYLLEALLEYGCSIDGVGEMRDEISGENVPCVTCASDDFCRE